MRHAMCALAAAAVAACGTTQSYQEREAALAAEAAARQGEEVNQICFSQSINGWREFGDDAILLRKGVNDWYKLDLSGTCEPDWAMNAIALHGFGASSCLSRGDRVTTPDAPGSFSGSCFITRIYEWDEDAPLDGEDGAAAGDDGAEGMAGG